MKVYLIRCDVNHYQDILACDPKSRSLEDVGFFGQPRADSWQDCGYYIQKPNDRRGGFFGNVHGIGSFIIDSKTYDLVGDLLEMSGELLPIHFDGEDFFVVNVTNVVNVLDHSRLVWRYEPGSGPIDQYAFFGNRIPEAPLFKVPDQNSVKIFTHSGRLDPEDEFKGRVEKHGIEGLIFEEVWSDD